MQTHPGWPQLLLVRFIAVPQPAPNCAALQVILLSEGHVLYFGPPSSAVPWFGSLQYDYLPERDGNVSDWLLDLVSVGFTKPEVRLLVAPDAASALTCTCAPALACLHGMPDD